MTDRRVELKTKALLDRIGNLENLVADLRVELTIVTEDNAQLKSELNLGQALDEAKAEAPSQDS